MSRLREFLAACRNDGWRNAWCGWCHLRPTMADDIGFFFLSPYDRTAKPACHHCYEHGPGTRHRERFGTGER